MSTHLQTLHTRRWGVKGPQAAAWLQHHELSLPEPNHWGELHNGGLILRLGVSEFFLEEPDPHTVLDSQIQLLAAEFFEAVPGVYPVLREDRVLQLTGPVAERVLAEACSFDVGRLPAASHEVVMTLLLGVAVTMVVEQSGTARSYRIWCDPSYGDGLYAALQAIVEDAQ